MPPISGAWAKALEGEFRKPYYKKLFETVSREYRTHRVYPPAEDIFNAFHLTPPGTGKGGDPGAGSLSRGGPGPGPVLFRTARNRDSPFAGQYIPGAGGGSGLLYPQQRMSGEMGPPGSAAFKYSADGPGPSGQLPPGDRLGRIYGRGHPGSGGSGPPMVFILWGRPAQMKKAMIHNPAHLVLEAPHPSPLSAFRGFFGSRPFSRTNEYLVKNGLEPIDWQIENITGQT